MAIPGKRATSPDAPPEYSERLAIAWWAWPATLGIAALLAAEIFLGRSTALAWLPYAILLPATAAALFALSRVRIRVAGGELFVDDAHIPVRYISEVNPLDGAAKRALLGPLAVPNVFVVQRPWIAGGVRVVIDDPDDPTPYWVVSSRHPDQLAEALIQARDAVTGTDPR
jgi:Protein of unknown function (DUF3093)